MALYSMRTGLGGKCRGWERGKRNGQFKKWGTRWGNKSQGQQRNLALVGSREKLTIMLRGEVMGRVWFFGGR